MSGYIPGRVNCNELLQKFEKFCKFVLTEKDGWDIITFVKQRWRNWQTRTVQVRVVAIP